MKKNKVYFITDGKYIKIGFTMKDIESRVSQLQTGNPNKLKLLFYVDSDKSFEKFLHKHFAKHKVLNEWFDIVTTKDEIEKLQYHFENKNTSDCSKEEYLGIKVYIKYNHLANQIRKGRDYVVMYRLCHLMASDKNTFILSEELLKDIKLTLNITKVSLMKSIEQLKAFKIINESQNIYMMNPFMFWKGSNETRAELINKGMIKRMFESI